MLSRAAQGTTSAPRHAGPGDARVTRRQHHHPVARLDHREEEVPKRFIEPARQEDLLGAQVAISARDRVPQIRGRRRG